MAILTFISDFGTADPYVAMVKGAVYSQLPEAKIVDISHEVSPFNVTEAAFHLRQSYSVFPRGTVHLIGVNADHSADTPHRIAVYDGHYFIAADGGIFSLIFDKQPDAVYDINVPYDSDILTFPVLHRLVKVACHLLRGGTPEVIARQAESVTEATRLRPIIDGDSIRGHVVYVDRFDNLVTDISSSMFREVGKSRDFTIHLRTERHKIEKISSHYNEVPNGEKVGLFNSAGVLEIGIGGGAPESGGGAAQLFGLKKGDLILVVFHDRSNR
ncbi:SAM hydrolase/SAM-dependent halogenase family protein [Sanyastnella coralliicola]|uniref:SAM hydrolase/SAM-dependent halogenase family protein n=1 Tax=Sanyastnella coralliicola TaxID=3069118 RepID=UPI0027B9E8DD|nr:SAM-dependent chlorinase/fluorinase [Longitalea sp. SCSIO 12813]